MVIIIIIVIIIISLEGYYEIAISLNMPAMKLESFWKATWQHTRHLDVTFVSKVNFRYVVDSVTELCGERWYMQGEFVEIVNRVLEFYTQSEDKCKR